MVYRFVNLLIISLFSSFLWANDNANVDSLKIVVLQGSSEERMESLIALGKAYRYIDSDSALNYLVLARDVATIDKSDINKGQSLLHIGIIQLDMGKIDEAYKSFNKALKLLEKVDDKAGISSCYLNIGAISYYQDSYAFAKECYEKSLAMDIALDNKRGMSNNYGNIGLVFRNQSLYDSALVYYFRQLKLAEEIQYVRGQSNCLGNIGAIYIEQGFYVKAIEYYTFQYDKAIEIEYTRGISNALGSLGNAYMELQDYYKAKDYLNQSYKIKKERNDLYGLATCLHNLGEVDTELELFTEASRFFLEAIAIEEQIEDISGQADTYNALANVYLLQYDRDKNSINKHNYLLDMALKHATKSLKIGREIQSLSIINHAATTLMRTYKGYNNHSKALTYAQLAIETKDSIHNNNVSDAIAELQVKHETEKQHLLIEQMETQGELDKTLIEIQQATNKKQKIFIISMLLGLFLLLSFSFIIVRLFYQKRKTNIALAKQKEALSEQNGIITSQKKGLTDSITYANRIQTAILPEVEKMISDLSDHFVMFKPRDIVSGDFYWLGKVNKHIIIISADCTGHGVPGAFMSMLGTAFLNEIIINEKITTPSIILDHLREKVIKSLKQKGEINETRDGMDIAAVSINLENQCMQFSGANNPLYLIKGDEQSTFIEIKANKQPIGHYVKMTPFTNHEIDLEKGDQFYLSTDGFPDQFGGPLGKKFKYKPFKELLIKNCKQPMQKQQKLLEESFNKWQGEMEQIDDVCIIGLKI